MSSLPGEFALFLRRRWWLWVLPIALFYALLLFLAWKQTQVADDPFVYDL